MLRDGHTKTFVVLHIAYKKMYPCCLDRRMSLLLLIIHERDCFSLRFGAALISVTISRSMENVALKRPSRYPRARDGGRLPHRGPGSRDSVHGGRSTLRCSGNKCPWSMSFIDCCTLIILTVQTIAKFWICPPLGSVKDTCLPFFQLSFCKSENHLLPLVNEVASGLGGRNASKTFYTVDMETAVSRPDVLGYSEHRYGFVNWISPLIQ